MEIDFSSLNWLAIFVCVIVGQVFLTLWFVVFFGEPWAKAYGAANKRQHTQEIPGYTYAVGLVCMVLLTLGLAILQQNLGVNSLSGATAVGLFCAVHLCVATALPGYAFLKRWRAFVLAIGSQTAVILLLSVILAVMN